MNRILLPNLFFEEELLSSPGARSPRARRVVSELGPVMGLLAAHTSTPHLTPPVAKSQRTIVVVADDCRPGNLPTALKHIEYRTIAEVAAIVTESASMDSQDDCCWEAVPWGWSDSALETLRSTGVHVKAPDRSVIRTINSRQFQAQFDVALHPGGTGRIDCFGALCWSMPEVVAATRTAYEFSGQGWVIKADLSHAARNRALGMSLVPADVHRNWLESRFAAGECVYVEPWVERIAECGLQFHVQQSEDSDPLIEFLGATQLLTDNSGRYRGSIVKGWSDDSWQPAIEHAGRIAESVARLAYFGPLGIDCMLFRHPKDNRPWLRLSHDINGRLTMGRLAMSLNGLAAPQEAAVWLHAPANLSESDREEADRCLTNGVRIISTSPGTVEGSAIKNRTLLLASKDPDRLKATCCEILGLSHSVVFG